MKKRFLLIALLIAQSLSQVKAQKNASVNASVSPGSSGDIPNILPPSPTAQGISRYALVGSNLSTGTANSHIPLYTFKTKNLSLPLSIDYSTDGFKVDDIASRVGTGWVFNAGGVVTRTIVGKPDEAGTYVNPPSDFPNTVNSELTTYLNTVLTAGYDTQPDVFSYNFTGNSGKFIILNGAIKKLEQNNLKITGSIDTGFEFTTPDGVKYLFNVIETTAAINSANPHYKVESNSSWFLSKITHPTGDFIKLGYNKTSFQYTANVNQSYTYLEGGESQCSNTIIAPESPKKEETTTIIKYNVVYLSSISSSSEADGALIFKSTEREDIPGDYLLSAISVRTNIQSGDIIKSISFNYDYITAQNYLNSYSNTNTNINKRLFLSGLSIGPEKYRFTYNDLSKLPPRLSFAQDDYGFFNGQTNQSLVPKPIEPKYSDAFQWFGYGSRLPNSNFSQIGLLNRIYYPTGGRDSLQYEPNTIYKTKDLNCDNPVSSVGVEAGGSSSLKKNQLYYSKVFNVTCDQYVTMTVGCVPLTVSGDGRPSYPVGEYLVSATLTAPSGNKEPVFDLIDKNGTRPQAVVNQHQVYTVYLLAGDYRVAIQVRGDARGYASFTYSKSIPITGNKEVAGIRLKRVISTDPVSKKENVKRYYYDDILTNRSTGRMLNEHPVYQMGYSTYGKCDATQWCLYTRKGYYKFSNGNYYGLSNLTGHHIYYGKVTESDSENFETGGVEHIFLHGNDGYSNVIMGNPIPGAPLSNSGINTHVEMETNTVLKSADSFVTIKKVKTTFFDDPRLESRNSFYVIQADGGYQNYCASGTTIRISNFPYLSISSYDLISRWTYPKTIETIVYDASGNNPVSSVVNYEYGNTNHQQVTQTATTNSSGKIESTEVKYPDEMVSDGNTIPYQEMVDQNIISPTIIQKTLSDGIQELNYTVYRKGWANPNLILPEIVKTQIGSDPAEIRLRYHNYDTNGNILTVSKESGPNVGYKWGYGHSKVVAEVKNASSEEFFLEDFEDDGSEGFAHTGKKYKVGGYLLKFLVPNARPYKYSYWFLSGGVWKYSGEIDYTSDIAINGFDGIDDVNVYPSDSQMTSYTYKPLVGITSQIGPDGNTIYYEYDNFMRLLNIKDRNRNIVKAYRYNFVGPPAAQGYSSEEQSGYFTRNNCEPGKSPGSVIFSVIAGAYTSYLSKADANSKAREYMLANGQVYANTNAVCISCNGIDFKVIDNVCQKGKKIYTSSVKDPGHNSNFTCTYHYEWNDGSKSGNYNETHVGECSIMNQ